jgi:nitrogenase molybdenum-iron protein alpha/beta subunit
MDRGRRDKRRALEALLDELQQRSDEEDFSLRTTYTYLLGVYLGINAIRDAFLLVEGPDCATMKAQYIQGNHDWLSTLTSVSGFSRVANTALHPAMMSDSREQPLERMMRRMAGHPEPGALLLTCMPMAFITGADYQRLCRRVAAECHKPVLYVPGKSLSGDWLDGYAEVLKSLAQQLDLSGGAPDPRRVAIVGYLWDRNEGDHAANVRLLGELCSALGLELVSVWLAGQPFAELARIRDAGTILALPYGRQAARRVARRTGAELIELPLPFGLDATEHWLEVLGERFDARAAARAYADARLEPVARRLEWLVAYLFQNLEVGYAGDPHLLPGLADTVALLGGRLRCAAVTNRAAHARGLGQRLDGVELLIWPKLRAFCRFLVGQVLEHDIRLLVANNYGVMFPLPDTAMVEFGFPSIFNHALYERPFMGFEGLLAFVDGLANDLRQQELARSRDALVAPRGE